MKLIIIESSVYKVTEKVYKEIKQKEEEILKQEYYHAQQGNFDNWLESIKQKLKFIGVVSFDFRL
jgi:hypothetical protein